MATPLTLFSLAGRVALVTGGAGHLGRAICRGLAEAGAHVLVNGRDKGRVDALVSELRAAGLDAEGVPFDVTNSDAMAEKIGALARLDILVNNALVGRGGTIDSTSPAQFGATYALVVEAAYALVRAARSLLGASGKGSVINIASMYGMVSPDPSIYGHSGFDNPPEYGAAKAGLLQLTRYLACHLAEEHIRVNAVSPGAFPPREKLQREQPEFLAALERKVPMRRVGRPEEVSGVVTFLAGDAASYITGANIPVDGGRTAW